MPKWLRKFTHNKILDHFRKQNKTDDNLESSLNKIKTHQQSNPDYKSVVRKK